jgi:ribose-phosphate pyrophosphokinase
MSELAVFTGLANPPLAHAIAEKLGVALRGRAIQRFPDTELNVELTDTVRNCDVYLVQPTGPPVDQNLVELLFMGDACWRAGASKITAVTPYFGYARQDRRAKGREAIGARLVADLLKAARISRSVAIDLHSPSLESVFSLPVEQLSAIDVLGSVLRDLMPSDGVVVAPDLGAVKLAQRYAQLLSLPMAVVHKVRTSAETVEVRSVIGEVRGRAPIVVDDMISTGGTIAAAITALVAAGASTEVLVAATHGLLTGSAVERLRPLPLKRLLVTDSLLVPKPANFPINTVSVAPLLADAIARLHLGRSLGGLIAHR